MADGHASGQLPVEEAERLRLCRAILKSGVRNDLERGKALIGLKSTTHG